jgi:hypothetical protein
MACVQLTHRNFRDVVAAERPVPTLVIFRDGIEVAGMDEVRMAMLGRRSPQ